MLYALYHAIIRMILRRALADISAGRTEALARQFRPDATFCFAGDHALGGELRGRAQIAAWFARIGRIFPGLTLTPLSIIVNGGPWNTTVATRFRVRATLPDGSAYANEGVQILRICWASIAEDRVFEDTDRLRAALEVIAKSGRPEALAPPLGDLQ
jgi:ketosteroid isomerase-like protein